MKKSDKEALAKSKINGGKTPTAAWKEVKEHEKYEKAFKNLYKENISLNKKVEKLEKNLEKAKGTIFKFKLQKDKEKEFNKTVQKEIVVNGSLRAIERIIHFMEFEKEYTRTDLSKMVCLTPQQTLIALRFIRKYKLIDIEEVQGNRGTPHYIRVR